MTDDPIERDALHCELDLLQEETFVEVIRSGDGFSLRTVGSRELAYLRKSDGWTPDQVACITFVFDELKDLLLQRVDLLLQRVEDMIDSVESAESTVGIAGGAAARRGDDRQS